jgi:hypothetical protein
MKNIKQIRETIPRNVKVAASMLWRALVGGLRMVCTILFVPPPQQQQIEEERIRVSELARHSRKIGGG